MNLGLQDIVTSLEIASAGVVSTVAAWHLGLTRVDILVGLFFTMAVVGQLTAAMLERVRAEL